MRVVVVRVVCLVLGLVLGGAAEAQTGGYRTITPTMADRTVTLTGNDLTPEQVVQVARYGAKVAISPEAKQRNADTYGLMLQGAAELRFQSFLWASDLSAQDTVAHVFGFPINIMPLLMGATMFYQMKLTPTPSVDNMQMKMMRFMPLIFTAFCYFFSCALALYSTINGLFTIVQQIVINKMKDPAEAGPVGPGAAAATTAAAFGKKPIKNVTPKKK